MSWNKFEFFSSRDKILFSQIKKMFAIYPDEKNEEKSVHYFSVQEASEKTGFPPKEIEKALQTINGRYFCPKDKKVFWVRDLIYQLCNNSNQDFYPPDSLFLTMQPYMPLGRLIDAWKNARKLEQTLRFLPPSHIQEKARDLVKEIENQF